MVAVAGALGMADLARRVVMRGMAVKFHRFQSMAPVVATALVLLSLVALPAAAGMCPYRLWPQMAPFTPAMITTPNSVCIYPDGRTSLDDATAGGIALLLYRVEYLTDAGTWTPIDFPDQGLMLGDPRSTLSVCGAPGPILVVDYSEGRPVFFERQPIPGGGHSPVDATGHPTGTAMFYWSPDMYCGATSLNLWFNSPDIDGSLSVDLADIPYLAADYQGAYNYRSDFDFDGAVGLTDIAVMAGALGAACTAR
jgi:hypothetical protein